MKGVNRKFIAWSSGLAYTMIGLEILFMISPVALYYYSVYSPILNWLDSYPLLSWTTKFIFPHFCETSSVLINNVSPIGIVLFVLGLILFILSASQLYFTKFTKRQVVFSGLYRYIRHPQYLAFGIMGLGTFLFWPRIIVLYLYVVMLLVYSWLAKWEEQLCLKEYGIEYEKYLTRTDRFIPGEKKIFKTRNDFRNIDHPFKTEASSLIVICSILLIGIFAEFFRDCSIRNLYTYSTKYSVSISLVEPHSGELKKLHEIIQNDSLLVDLIEKKKDTSKYKFLCYVAPAELAVPELPFSKIEQGPQHSHFIRRELNDGKYRILFCEPIVLIECIKSDMDLIKRTETIEPFLEVIVDLDSEQINRINSSSFTMKWQGIRTPLF